MTDSLSLADVQHLLADPSADTRAEMAAKVAHELERPGLNAEERRIAQEIVRVMARDAAQRVRQALAECLKESRHLPEEVAIRLARDVEAVSVPILQYSTVLGDDALVTLVRGATNAKLMAIARRRTLSELLSDALVAEDNPRAIAALVANEGAEIAEPTLHIVLSRHGADIEIGDSLACRSRLPVGILERMVAEASDRLRQKLMTRHDLPDRLASDLVFQIREQATVGLVSPLSPATEALELVTHLKEAGRLTPSLILRALCMGDLAMVEAAFSVLGKVPLHNARLLIHDAGPLGFKSLYDHSQLPKAFYRAFRVALDVARSTPFDGLAQDRERHRRRMVERILTQFEDVGAENLDYLLARLQQREAEEAEAEG
ncbi:MAG TPA: DUF2336 domain-containing protein [Stellaceae bacterium]|nr:DUF2336 domain-containing protein [Stellaceae bacterium]